MPTVAGVSVGAAVKMTWLEAVPIPPVKSAVEPAAGVASEAKVRMLLKAVPPALWLTSLKVVWPLLRVNAPTDSVVLAVGKLSRVNNPPPMVKGRTPKRFDVLVAVLLRISVDPGLTVRVPVTPKVPAPLIVVVPPSRI